LSMAFVTFDAREGFGTVGTRQGEEGKGSFRSINAGRRPKHARERAARLIWNELETLRRGFGKNSTGDL